jgi:hypothetical protein
VTIERSATITMLLIKQQRCLCVTAIFHAPTRGPAEQQCATGFDLLEFARQRFERVWNDMRP